MTGQPPDLVVRNGLIVDGTGAEPYRGDVAVADQRIVTVGEVEDRGVREVDAAGQIVAPGFIDVHTHYDAQALWDATLAPSLLHGVTTMIGGNCGFSIAPLTDRSAPYIKNMLSRVEGMPIEALESGPEWDWRSTAEFLKRLDGRLAPNTGWLVGHSAIRAAVMGADAQQPASADQVAAMRELLSAGLRAGALGFSSTWSTSHNDHLGSPVPSRYAVTDELISLCRTVGEFEGTSLEFIPSVGRFDDEMISLMSAMSAAANRPLNWNALMVEGISDEYIEHQLSAGDHAKARGGKVIALTPVESRHHLLNLRSGFVYDALPGWADFIALPLPERLKALSDPAFAAQLERGAASVQGGFMSRVADWPNVVLVETFTPEYCRFVGLTFEAIGQQLALSAWESFVRVVIADGLQTVVTMRDIGLDGETWRRRVALWRDKRTLIGASDAGAHLDMTDAFGYPTVMLGQIVRDRQLLPIEEAVSMMTRLPAALYGIRDRGTIRTGAWADLVIFDRASINCGPITSRFDLPAGAMRLFSTATGIGRVFVNGVEVLTDGEPTGACPGRILRSGQDTITPGMI